MDETVAYPNRTGKDWKIFVRNVQISHYTVGDSAHKPKPLMHSDIYLTPPAGDTVGEIHIFYHSRGRGAAESH
jgi:hypothetical protein